jgi:hypothetical protein
LSQLHILGYTLHSLLDSLAKSKHPDVRPGCIDDDIPTVLEVVMDGFVGEISKEKNFAQVRAAGKEAKTNRSFDSFELLAKLVNFRKMDELILRPVKSALEETQSLAVVKLLSEALRRIVFGLQSNPEAQPMELLSFVYRTIQNSNREEREQQQQQKKDRDEGQKDEEAPSFSSSQQTQNGGKRQSSYRHLVNNNINTLSSPRFSVGSNDLSALSEEEKEQRRRKTKNEIFAIDGKTSQSWTHKKKVVKNTQSHILTTFGLQTLLMAFRKHKFAALVAASAAEDDKKKKQQQQPQLVVGQEDDQKNDKKKKDPANLSLIQQLQNFVPLLRDTCLKLDTAHLTNTKSTQAYSQATSTDVLILSLKCVNFLLHFNIAAQPQSVSDLSNFIFSLLPVCLCVLLFLFFLSFCPPHSSFAIH